MTFKTCCSWRDRGRKAATSLELVVVIGVSGILIALSLYAVSRARASALRAQCANKLKQLALAVHQFEAAHRKLPEGCAYPFLRKRRDVLWQAGLSWQTAILPYLEHDSIWQEAWQAQSSDPSTTGVSHFAPRERIVPVFLCPTERLTFGNNLANGWKWGITSYIGVAGSDRFVNDGVFHNNFTLRLGEISDGTSCTMMIGERPAGPMGYFSAWYASWGNGVCPLNQILHAGNGRWNPAPGGCQISIGLFRPGTIDELCDVNHFWSLHTRGANFAFADGTVRFLSYSMADVIPSLATRAGADPISIE